MKIPPFHWWRTVFFLIPAVSLYTFVCGAVSLSAAVVERRGRVAHRCAQTWGWLVLRTTGVVVRRSGAPLPPEGQSAIFVANHASHYDTPILFVALPCQLRTIAKATLGRVPFIGWHLRLAGHLLVDRASPGVAIFRRMERLATQGTSLYVFPEGSRSVDGHVARFKRGVFLLAIETGLPIVPVTVKGSRQIMPKGRLMVMPGTVDVIVHEPVPTAGLTRADARTLAARVEAIVAAPLNAEPAPC